MIWNWLTYILLANYVASASLLLLMKYILRAHNTASKRYWKFYHYLIILTGCLVIGATSSIKSAGICARSFYNIFVKDVKIDLPPYVLAN